MSLALLRTKGWSDDRWYPGMTLYERAVSQGVSLKDEAGRLRSREELGRLLLRKKLGRSVAAEFLERQYLRTSPR